MQKVLARVVIIVVMVMGCQPLLAQKHQEDPSIRVAIVDFTTTSQEAEHAQLAVVVPEWLTTFFVKKPRFEVIERRQLEALLQEQALGQSGVLDQQSAARVGQVLGVDVLITGTIISIADTLEVTARVVDADTGTIVGAANVTVDDEEDLRDHIDALGKDLIKALAAENSGDVVWFESFDEERLNPERWEMMFEEKITARDQANTQWSQQAGILRLTGTYQGEDEHRATWIASQLAETYTSVEVTFRIDALQGEVEVCLGASWDDTPWTGVCPYFGEDFGAMTVYLEDDQEEEREIDVELNIGQWYRLRLQAGEEELLYYLDDVLLASLAPDTPVRSSEGIWAEVGAWLWGTRHVVVEFDEVIFRK